MIIIIMSWSPMMMIAIRQKSNFALNLVLIKMVNFLLEPSDLGLNLGCGQYLDSFIDDTCNCTRTSNTTLVRTLFVVEAL